MTVTVRQWDDRESWNHFVAATPHAHFQQSWEWGDLAADLGGEAVRLAALRDGRLIGGAQVFINPLLGPRATHLYIPRGPAVLEPDIETLGPLFDAAREIGAEHQAVGIRVEANAPACSPQWKSNLAALGLRPTFPNNQPRSSWMLDISPDAGTLLAQMKSKTRYNIRLAGRKGVVVEEAGPEVMPEFYELYRETAERDDFFIQPLPIYYRMFDLFRRAGSFCLLTARYQNQLIAAVTLVRFGTTCWYLHGASSNQHRNLMATYLLQWEAIQRAQQWGCSLYDFRAIPVVLREDQDMYGVYRFKEGFGGFQYTTMHTWSAAYRPALFGLWQLYFRAEFDLRGWNRRRHGLPARQHA